MRYIIEQKNRMMDSRKDEDELSDKPIMGDWTYIPGLFIVRYNLFVVPSQLNYCSPWTEELL